MLSKAVSISRPDVPTPLEYELLAVPRPVWIDSVCDQLSGSSAFRRDQPEIAGWVSLWRLGSGQKNIENLVSFGRPPRPACRLAKRDLPRIPSCEGFNPNLRDTTNITNEGYSVAVRGKARLPVCSRESGDWESSLLQLGRNVRPAQPPDRQPTDERDEQQQEKQGQSSAVPLLV